MPNRIDRLLLAEEAVRLVKPSINRLLSGRGKRKNLAIVILDPALKPWEIPVADKWNSPEFQRDVVLFNYSFGSPGKWEYPYMNIAIAKAYMAWREGEPNILTNMLGAATMREDDTIYWGSVYDHGLVVAASGIQPWFDTLICSWVAAAYQSLAQDDLQKFMKENPEASFLK